VLRFFFFTENKGHNYLLTFPDLRENHVRAGHNKTSPFCQSQPNPYPANVEKEYGELLIMPANGKWDLTRRLKG
jgi:hypothetical protein